MIIGPGTITTILLLTSKEPSLLNAVLVAVTGLFATAKTFILLRYSGKNNALLKPSTIRAIR